MNWSIEVYNNAYGRWIPLTGANGSKRYIAGWFDGLQSFYPRPALRIVDSEGRVHEQSHAGGSPRPAHTEVVDGGHSVQELKRRTDYAEARAMGLQNQLTDLLEWQKNTMAYTRKLEMELNDAEDIVDMLEDNEHFLENECCVQNIKTYGSTESSSGMEQSSKDSSTEKTT